MNFILAFVSFNVIENLYSLGRTSTGAERIDIREHRSAGLTKNARVCLHAGPPIASGVLDVIPASSVQMAYLNGHNHSPLNVQLALIHS